MISVKNKEPLIYYGSKTIKEVYKGSTKIYPSVDTLKIMDSLVCWYDIGKQQCTNESMAANPVLADLSGNGHDIECFNFGWSGMSGIGGYKVNFNEFSVADNNSVKEHTYNKIVVYNTEDVNTNFWNNFMNLAPGETYHIDSYKVRISGLSDEETVRYRYYNLNDDNSISHIDIPLRNGIHTIPEINMTSIAGIVDTYITVFQYVLSNIINKQITIELLPEYPNALVSDGVDDYCYTEGLPILTDYTVIANRTVIDKEKVNCIFAVKGETGVNNVNQAFAIDIVNHEGHYFYSSFGLATKNIHDFRNDDLLICTKNKINDTTITPGNTIDNFPNMNLFGYPASNRYIVAALYSFLLFDRTLTTAEIEWVKKNMIESGGVLKTDWSDSSLWAFRDGIHTVNDKRVEGTLSSNIMVITSCITTNNFMEAVIENTQTPAYNIKVTGLKNGITLQYKDAYTATYLYFNEDGIYTIPAHNTNGRWYGFSFNKTFENENIVIQQLLS